MKRRSLILEKRILTMNKLDKIRDLILWEIYVFDFSFWRESHGRLFQMKEPDLDDCGESLRDGLCLAIRQKLNIPKNE
jgi:hypothetical protein